MSEWWYLPVALIVAVALAAIIGHLVVRLTTL
jgi:hypothetical protein